LNNLKRTNNNNFIKSFNIFVKEFAFLNNVKKKKILNFIIVKIKNFDNVIKKKIISKRLNTRFKIM